MAVYTLPELPYDYSALEPAISGEIIELHHDKHHATYVKGANDTLEQLAEAREKDSWGSINQLEKNLAFHLSGHILHSIYWGNMNREGGGEPSEADGTGELAEAIRENFGSFARFKAQLSKAAVGTQGSGWGVLSYDPLGDRMLVHQVYDHQGNVGQAGIPLFVIDTWEHAFYLQYRNVKADFVEASWRIANWHDVQDRYRRAKAGASGLLVVR
ncbi:superoxide dismutase [Allostreptomyces psammosilenae]|uniref:Superoxide dismutase n=1 Tax=Allostreptomyces psammosilenae TaxID=1892865 RepID=A0A852ZNR6_9ACTN|nr:superoxide dismutase [Allostreptomyces psammosilenae]NYI04096.1 Fe-Mn family superoxide dismutase [Allostreptomyces psammosilenae]